ncbi:protein TIC 62, chloroplastic isoform X1 [Ananas comosus]|uniref:Protein TIC 62, chloroplastic isoform X1 n=1 Tax=Ananas comosus TaxID=4615 RepID=A0A6P5GD35_ANACO|nr:protein TIC 62, chloroplastic isoform X1 [Ananas comosus]
MELFSLQFLTPPLRLRRASLCLVGRGEVHKPNSLFGEAVAFPRRSTRCPDGKNHSFFHSNSASVKASSGSTLPSTSAATKQEMSSKEKEVVFVAGSTGRVGSRTVRELIRLGFRVRAGVRSSQRAEPLVQSVRNMNLDSGTPPVEKLEIVECDLENEGGIVPAIANASVVICCIGASEKEVFDVTGPYRIDYKATKNLIDAATTAKVDHFILLTSLGTSKIGFPAAILNLFWGVLIWKRKAEEALIASGLPFTIVRPGGMERPTDSYKETHNLVLADEDTFFGGQVSNLQVAELMACMAKNRRLSFCKVVEVIAETTAPLLPMEELLAKIPSKRALPAELELNFALSSAEEIVKEKPKDRPLSPYTVYDDLKPPTSPTPTKPSTSAAHDPGYKAKPLSPYTAQDGLKPPSSPSPPNSPSTADGSPQTITAKESEPAKQRPLSPYTMYEDLKPPSSPVPSVPKF